MACMSGEWTCRSAGRTVSERERNHNTIRAVRVQGAALDYQRRVRGEVS